MIAPVEFLNAEYVGRTGTMEVDDIGRFVVAVRFEDGTTVPDDPPYSYRVIEDA